MQPEKLRSLSGHLNEHFAHGTLGKAAECGLYLFEGEHAIDYGLAIDGVETATIFFQSTWAVSGV